MRIEDIEIADIIEFRDHGSRDNAPAELVEFLSMLEKVRGMHLRFDTYGSRDAIIKHLTTIDGLSHYMACKYHDMAMEYFYSDRNISKQAWRNILAEKMEKGVNLAFAMASDVKEVLAAVKSIGDIAKVLNLDQNDPEQLPEELLKKPWKMYSLDTEFLGLPSIDRFELARIIDELPQLTEKERLMAKREALIQPPKLFLEPNEDPRSNK